LHSETHKNGLASIIFGNGKNAWRGICGKNYVCLFYIELCLLSRGTIFQQQAAKTRNISTQEYDKKICKDLCYDCYDALFFRINNTSAQIKKTPKIPVFFLCIHAFTVILFFRAIPLTIG
jgi:hypothetical protein